ncbi:alpha-mannosidase [Paenibacillus baekrokdamisoli]|uniref:Alpha-mannosidase n=1 Tax=Paenibacillus baekrokdamisoli TaxID=1712516 RepID=A0A3G9JCT2_9BACL|nr:alpha-mannosidase [Paenibacillus baekrokdamisoli]MBB3068950.1 alpha-mannosidase [Paenibacillus baekrokdamisoli]BBH23771.1 alpha-mannosidase [Paenibacillus baekrokdamisoli]
MLLTESKIKQRLLQLEATRYRDAKPIASFRWMEDEAGEIAAKPPQGGEWSTIKLGDTWVGRDRYAWLSHELNIPQEWTGRKVLGRFDFGETEGGNNAGFESLFFLNGAPYQGVDSNHKEVFLPEEAVGNDIQMDIRLWSGLEGGGPPKPRKHTILLAELCWLDVQVDDYYYTAWAASDTVKALDPNHSDRVRLMNALDRSLLHIDWSYPRSEAFYSSVYAACDSLRADLADIEKHSRVTVTCVGHTHIDVAWLWRLKHTREKCARSFSTVLRLMEMFPDYVFLQTQPQLYEYIKTDYPEIYEKIRERVREGRWEAGGGMWLEADCNLTSGESLVRQLLFGTRFLRNEFGVECQYLWLPDVFGYSWALPQILKKSGISTFMTTKISWSQFNRMPHDTFQWRGIDGSEVLTHFITTPDEHDSPYYTYNGVVEAQMVKGIWDNYRDKNINEELLLSYGYGDGGGGVNREMLEMRRRLDEMPGLPHVQTGTAEAYFKRLQDRVASTDQYVHTWDGELYLEFHRGTYTSQAYNKRMNRKLELAYRETEWFGAYASLLSGNWSSYLQDELNSGWKIILRNQFHDIIPGSSIKEVYEDSTLEYNEAEQTVRTAWAHAADSVVEPKADQITVWNSAPWARLDLLTIESTAGTSDGTWTNAGGEVLPAQRSGDQWTIQMEVPSMGHTTIGFNPGVTENTEKSSDSTFAFGPSSIRTPYYRIAWNETGQLIEIWDEAAQKQVLANGEKGNVLQVFEDKPLMFDAWDIDIYYQQKMREVTDLQSAEFIHSGSLSASVRFVWNYMSSTISQVMKVYADSRRIDFQTEVDWQERQQLLKVAFPVAVRSTEATYDIQFGNVKRPTHWNTSWDWARFETVGHQWADLSERGYGVSLLNDCKYGYDIKGHTMRMSLIKSAIEPDPDADKGFHSFTYALLPHQGDWYEGGTVQEAWALNNPLTSSNGISPAVESSLLRVSSGGVMIDAVKKAEDNDRLVVRLHDYAGSRDLVTLISDLTIVSWQECDLMERPIGELQVSAAVEFTLLPYEIKTFILEIRA